jgi:RNA polymerase sigma-70 factor, ECF subfamily
MSEPDAPEPTRALLEAARRGDARALDRLIAAHQDRIYRFGLKMCRDPADAEDVLQETLLSMARGIDAFREDAALSTWLYTIARSHCIKKRRRSKFAPDAVHSLEGEAHPEARDVADDGRSPDDALAAKRVEDALEAAIDALAPKYREVLILRDVEGLTAPEVANVLGISAAAVKSRLHRARRAVRDAVAPRLGIGQPEAPRPCPDVLSRLSRHLEGELGAAECAEMERHLEGCADCRLDCDSLRETLALCRSSASAPSAKVPEAVAESVRRALRDLFSGPA